LVGSGFRDPISGIRDGEKSGSGINIPDPQHLVLRMVEKRNNARCGARGRGALGDGL